MRFISERLLMDGGRRWIILLVCFLVYLSAVQVGIGGATEYQQVSIIDLIANPEKYHQKKVCLQGYLVLEGENEAIYLSQWDGQNHIFKNAVWVRLDQEQVGQYRELSRKTATVWGEFTKDSNGHFGLYSGTIDGVVRIADYSSK